jgi:hypothetical protein
MMKFLLNLLGNFIGPISDEKLEKIKPWLKLFLVISIVIIIVFYIIGEKFMFKNRKGFWSISTNGSLASELDFSTSELVSRRSRRSRRSLASNPILPVDEDTKSIVSDTIKSITTTSEHKTD